MKPYYERDGITICHGDCREILPLVKADVLVSDPPYGCSATTGRGGKYDKFEVAGDADSTLRDIVLAAWRGPAIVFGSPRVARPVHKALLIWAKGEHTGMGDLDFPWKPDFEEVYVIGEGFAGHRGSSVLRYNARTDSGRLHPTEKPQDLMEALVAKCPPGTILDPFAGSGTTLLAARACGRRAIGIEIEERYCEIAAKRLAQGVLDFGRSAP